MFTEKLAKSITIYLLTILLLPISVINAQTITLEKRNYYKEIAENIIRSSLTDRKGYDWLREICEIGPRLSGSENMQKAINWAEAKMNELGFDRIWLQPVMVPNWVRGDIETAVILNSNKHSGRQLSIMAFGGSVGTEEEGITAQVIEVKDFDELEKRKDEAKGKIVFFSRSLDHGMVNTFPAYGGAVNQRSVGAIYAAKYGAIGVIVRSVTTKKDNVPHTGQMRYDNNYKLIPSVAIGYSDADFLSELLKEEPEIQINLKLNCKTLPDVLSYNVIGDILGTEKPDEIVIVSGHYDSWDAGCGAHDDAGGCMQALETLDLFKRLNLQPRRTIRCILYVNEENGVRGAIEYGNYADTVSTEKHIAAIESDRGVFTPRGFTVDADSNVISQLQNFLPILREARIEWIKKGGSGVDISFIKKAKALIGYFPDDQRYFDFHHSENDMFEEVHPREMQLGTAAIAILTYLLSEEFMIE